MSPPCCHPKQWCCLLYRGLLYLLVLIYYEPGAAKMKLVKVSVILMRKLTRASFSPSETKRKCSVKLTLDWSFTWYSAEAFYIHSKMSQKHSVIFTATDNWAAATINMWQYLIDDLQQLLVNFIFIHFFKNKKKEKCKCSSESERIVAVNQKVLVQISLLLWTNGGLGVKVPGITSVWLALLFLLF